MTQINRSTRSKVFSEISKIVEKESLNLDQMIHDFVSYTIAETGADRGILLTVNPDLKFRYCLDRQGNNSATADNFNLSVPMQAICTRKSMLLTEAYNLDEEDFEVNNLKAHILRSIICVPLITPNEAIGALYLDSPTLFRTFRKHDLVLAELACSHMAIHMAGNDIP